MEGAVIGIFGGSFDPFHKGHLYLVQELLRDQRFEKLYLIPAGSNPLKPGGPIASGPDRFAMVAAGLKELADPRVECLDWEIKRKGPSYTVATLEEFGKKGLRDLALIVGNELFGEMPRWREPKKIFSLANVFVVTRHANVFFQPQSVLENVGIHNFSSEGKRLWHSNHSRFVEEKVIDALPISATDVRRELATLWKSGDLPPLPSSLQRSVWLHIKEKRLYAVTN